MNHVDPLDDTDATVKLVRGGALQQCPLDRRQLVVGTVAGLLAQAALPRPGVLVAGAVLVGLGTTFTLPPCVASSPDSPRAWRPAPWRPTVPAWRPGRASASRRQAGCPPTRLRGSGGVAHHLDRRPPTCVLTPSRPRSPRSPRGSRPVRRPGQQFGAGRRGPVGGGARLRHRHPAHAGHLLPRPALLRGGRRPHRPSASRAQNCTSASPVSSLTTKLRKKNPKNRTFSTRITYT